MCYTLNLFVYNFLMNNKLVGGYSGLTYVKSLEFDPL